MPRKTRVRKLFPVALSPSACADAIGVHPRVIAAAIRYQGLPCYAHGVARRVVVEDLVFWLRSSWRKIEHTALGREIIEGEQNVATDL